MASSKNGGAIDVDSDSNALLLPKPVTSSTRQQAKESAIASKRLLQSSQSKPGKLVVTLSTSAATGKSRTLTAEEVLSLRETKRQVAEYVMRELANRTK